MRTEKYMREIGYFVVANPSEYRVDFLIYQTEGTPKDGTPLFHRKESPSYPDPVGTTEESEIYARGSVKWDGCSNWWFDEQERGVMLHACTKQNLLDIGIVLAECWEMAKDLCPRFDYA